eukprot:scaffold9523_cov103-Cylindrotheca_fusiformis.AAC.14
MGQAGFDSCFMVVMNPTNGHRYQLACARTRKIGLAVVEFERKCSSKDGDEDVRLFVSNVYKNSR